MGIQSIYIVNKSGGLIYQWDAPLAALEVEKTFRYPLDFKLAIKRDIINRWRVTFGERDGIKVGHTILAINGIPAEGLKLQDGREISEVLEKQDNYPISIKFGKIRPCLNEKMFFASTFHSLYAIASQLSPEHKSSGIEVLEADTFKLYCHQTVTGIKFMAIADPRQGNVDALLRKIFEIYADYGLKNPFYALEQPIRCELFDINLQQAVEAIDHVTSRMQKSLPKKLPVAGVRKVVLVSSAKGGVGKSTTTVNIAICAAKKGLSVGLLDADVFGPSIPKMMNLSGAPELNSQNLMKPLQNFDVRVMSMGFLVDEAKPIAWRGLMVMQGIQRLLRNVAWGPLDLLFVDMPPGTGDVQLSIAQNIPIDGAVIVTTPQAIALLDARRGIEMFRKMEVPILGIVENMAEHVCEKCSHVTHIFGREGAKQMAEQQNVPIIGSIPLEMSIRACSDEGKPIAVLKPDSLITNSYKKLTDDLIAGLKLQQK